MTVAYPRKLNDRFSARDVLTRVVKDREIHLILLNRYRYNEQHSCKDLTDTIEQLQGKEPELIRDLSHHINDEARHAMWLTDLLVDLGAAVDTPPGISYIDEFDRLLNVGQIQTVEDKVIEGLAAINVTEKRGCEYFSAHIYALKQAPQTEENIQIRSVIERIFPEEAAHVRWGNRQLARIAAKSPRHRQKVEIAKLKYIAIEHAAFTSGSDIMLGAELRRLENVFKVVETLPLWQRPQYLLDKVPQTLFSPELQQVRLTAAKRAWERDPQAFVTQFIPMFMGRNREQN